MSAVNTAARPLSLEPVAPRPGQRRGGGRVVGGPGLGPVIPVLGRMVEVQITAFTRGTFIRREPS